VTPNNPMQRAGTHKVLGRGRSMFSQSQVRLARVLNCRRAVADGYRWANAGLRHHLWLRIKNRNLRRYGNVQRTEGSPKSQHRMRTLITAALLINIGGCASSSTVRTPGLCDINTSTGEWVRLEDRSPTNPNMSAVWFRESATGDLYNCSRLVGTICHQPFILLKMNKDGSYEEFVFACTSNRTEQGAYAQQPHGARRDT
jgi:hypothetical protein